MMYSTWETYTWAGYRITIVRDRDIRIPQVQPTDLRWISTMTCATPTLAVSSSDSWAASAGCAGLRTATTALPVSRLTAADCTSGRADSSRFTAPEQPPHFMPSTSSRMASVPTSSAAVSQLMQHAVKQLPRLGGQHNRMDWAVIYYSKVPWLHEHLVQLWYKDMQALEKRQTWCMRSCGWIGGGCSAANDAVTEAAAGH